MRCHFTGGVECDVLNPDCGKCGHNPTASRERLEKRFPKKYAKKKTRKTTER